MAAEMGAVNPEVIVRLFLVRHGQTEFNATHRYQGHLPVPLSDVGRSQAERLAQRFARIERTLPFDHVMSSDLRRAVETAELVFDRTRVATTVGLRERGLGDIEGRTRGEVSRDFPSFAAAWAIDPSTVEGDGVEAFGDFLERLVGELERCKKTLRGRRVVWVTHGFAIRALLHVITGIAVGDLWRFAISNTSVTEIDFSAARPRVLRLNDHAHLDGSSGVPENDARRLPRC